MKGENKPEKFLEWVCGEATIVAVIVVVARKSILLGDTMIIVQLPSVGIIQQIVRFIYFNKPRFSRWIVILVRMPACE